MLVFDEVQSFRVAPGGAQEMFGVTPDLTASARSSAAGCRWAPSGAGATSWRCTIPTAAGGARIAHAGTFNANPMTLVAGEAVMLALTPQVYRRMAELGEPLRTSCAPRSPRPGVAAQVTGVASLFGIHFTPRPIRNYRDVVAGDAGDDAGGVHRPPERGRPAPDDLRGVARRHDHGSRDRHARRRFRPRGRRVRG